MPFIKIYIHCVWSTKNRIQLLNAPVLRQKVWHHITQNAKEKGIFIDFINGHSDHCRCLISLGVDQNMKTVVQLLKGEFAHWINKNSLTTSKFGWQDEFFAVQYLNQCLTRLGSTLDIKKNITKGRRFRRSMKSLSANMNFLAEGNSKILRNPQETSF